MLNDEITIERISEKDIIFCADEVFNTNFGKIYYPSAEILKRVLKEANEKDLIFVAKQNGKVVGFIWFSFNSMFGKFPYLNLIFVFDKYRKNGIGKMLLNHFEKTSFDSCKNPKLKVFLVVKDNNENAIEFYKKNGYLTIGTLEGLFRASVNEILMIKYIKY